jgi:hypothetical protein
VKPQQTPYDSSIRDMQALHGETLADFLTCDEDNPNRKLLSHDVDIVKGFLDLLQLLKDSYENNLRNTPG